MGVISDILMKISNYELFGVFLFSFPSVVFFSLILWADVRRRAEYGKRHRVFLVSIVLLAMSGILISLLRFSPEIFKIQSQLMIFCIVSLLFLASLTLLEFSIHMQRIESSFLMTDFKNSLKSLFMVLFVSTTLITVILIIFYLIHPYFNKTIFAFLASGKNKNNPLDAFYEAEFLFSILFAVSFTGLVFRSTSIFDIQKEVIRQTEYTFNTFKYTIYIFLIYIIFLKGIRRPIPFPLFFFTNVVYMTRALQEYFFNRTNHLIDLQMKQKEAVEKRNNLINNIISSPVEGDNAIVRDLIEISLKKLKESVILPEYAFKGISVYRRKKNLIKIDSAEHIIGYCAPLKEYENIKKINREQLARELLKQNFDIAEISDSDNTRLSGFGEVAIKKLLETRQRVYINPLPECYKRIYRLICLYPIFNNDDLTGFISLFKDSFNDIYPEEDNELISLAENLSTIFSIMDGKALQEERNRLKGEMSMARKIQTSILPKEIKIEGWDIEGFMQTATEVGGDVYDYLNTKFGNYFGIGDVSGHGLPAGIMALIQMASSHGALHASERLEKELSVSDLYDIVNLTLCEINNERIGSGKFMTQNFLVEKEGSFSFAGSHEIAFLYRKEKNKIEELSGMTAKTGFLGISRYLKSSSSLGSFKMESGDILLLYTDGVIEAKNHYSKQFDMKNLSKILYENAAKNSGEIIGAIMNAVKVYAEDGDLKNHGGDFVDDVTLLVLKRK